MLFMQRSDSEDCMCNLHITLSVLACSEEGLVSKAQEVSRLSWLACVHSWENHNLTRSPLMRCKCSKYYTPWQHKSKPNGRRLTRPYRLRFSPSLLSQMQGVASGRDVIAAAAGAARGWRCVYIDGHGGCSPRPKYLKTSIIIIALASSNTIQDRTPGQGYLIVRSSIKSISY